MTTISTPVAANKRGSGGSQWQWKHPTIAAVTVFDATAATIATATTTTAISAAIERMGSFSGVMFKILP